MHTTSMYFFNYHFQGGWEHEYRDFECDADAMTHGREKLIQTDSYNMVAIYRHKDRDTCGIKKFVASYDKL